MSKLAQAIALLNEVAAEGVAPGTATASEAMLDMDANGSVVLQNVAAYKAATSDGFEKFIPDRYMVDAARDIATTDHQRTQIERNVSNARANSVFRGGSDPAYMEGSNLYARTVLGIGPWAPGAALEAVSVPGSNYFDTAEGRRGVPAVAPQEVLGIIKTWHERWKADGRLPYWVLNPISRGEVR